MLVSDVALNEYNEDTWQLLLKYYRSTFGKMLKCGQCCSITIPSIRSKQDKESSYGFKNEKSNYRRFKRNIIGAMFFVLGGRKSRRRLCYVLILILIMALLLFYRLHWFRDFIYIIRPIFDKKVTFKHVITHYHAHHYLNNNDENHHFNKSLQQTWNKNLCGLHGWHSRDIGYSLGRRPIKIIDAFLFSQEMDIMDLRLRELWPMVDLFIVMESSLTFSGKKKPLLLKQEIESTEPRGGRFQWAMSKIKFYECKDLRPLKPGESPFENEILMRNCMNWAIRSNRVMRDDLIIVGDADEIPRRSTIELFRKCEGYPSVVHMQMKTFFYSFEFYYSWDDFWQSKIFVYDPMSFYYSHQKLSEYLLADSGWHCTFCFRYLEDFRFKMTAYSHNDRLMGRHYLLSNPEIQKRICNGADVYDMYPEVYTFKEMVQKFGSIPSTDSFVDVPVGLLQDPERFKFLLKGNCLREDFQEH